MPALWALATRETKRGSTNLVLHSSGSDPLPAHQASGPLKCPSFGAGIFNFILILVSEVLWPSFRLGTFSWPIALRDLLTILLSHLPNTHLLRCQHIVSGSCRTAAHFSPNIDIRHPFLPQLQHSLRHSLRPSWSCCVPPRFDTGRIKPMRDCPFRQAKFGRNLRDREPAPGPNGNLSSKVLVSVHC